MSHLESRMARPINTDAIEGLFKPTPLKQYADLTIGGQVTITLNQEQACAALQAHEYGIEYVPATTKLILDNLISDLKQEICP